jgi:hypothetical protein
MSTYDKDYATRMLKDAIDYAEATGDFTHARKWSRAIEEVCNEQQKSIGDLEEGMKLMMDMTPAPLFVEPEQRQADADAICESYEHTYMDKKISTLDGAMQKVRAIALDNGRLRSYASYNRSFSGGSWDNHEVHSYTYGGE